MATVDELVVRIEADMSDLKRKLKQSSDAVDKSVGKQKRNFLSLGTTIKGVIGVVIAGQVARFAQHMIRMSSAVEEMQAKSSVVFGEFTGSVRAELEQFGDVVGRSTFELEGMASSIQDTFVPMGFARGEASKLSVQLTKLAVDVASFNNASDVDTMRAFQSALVGNHETVRRFGVVITEATLKQELLRMGINKSADQITNQEKVQARLNLILAGTTDAHNDAARTADSFANRSKALGGALEELGVGVVTPLLEDLADLVGGLVKATNATKEFLLEAGIIDRDISTQIARTKEINRLKEKEAELQDIITNGSKRARGQRLRELRVIQDQIKAIQGLNFAIDTEKRLKQQTAPFPVVDKNIVNLTEGQMPKLRDPDEIERVKEEQKKLDEQRKKTLDLVKRLDEAEQDQLSKLIEKQKEEMGIVNELIGKQKDFTAERNALNEALRNGSITLQQYNIGMRNLQEQMMATTQEGRMALQAVDGLSDGLANTLVTAMETGKFSLKSLGSTVKQVMAEMAQDFLKAQIRAVMLKFAMSALGLGAPSASAFTGSGPLSGVGNYAGGGRVQAKRPIMVGERGPELFIPNTGGVVKNNMDTKGMMGGGKPVVINQNLNFSTGVSQTVRAEVMNMLPQIQSSTLEAMIDAKQRGGSFATIMS